MAVDTDERIAFKEDHKCCNTGIGRLPTCMPLIQDCIKDYLYYGNGQIHERL